MQSHTVIASGLQHDNAGRCHWLFHIGIFTRHRRKIRRAVGVRWDLSGASLDVVDRFHSRVRRDVQQSVESTSSDYEDKSRSSQGKTLKIIDSALSPRLTNNVMPSYSWGNRRSPPFRRTFNRGSCTRWSARFWRSTSFSSDAGRPSIRSRETSKFFHSSYRRMGMTTQGLDRNSSTAKAITTAYGSVSAYLF